MTEENRSIEPRWSCFWKWTVFCILDTFENKQWKNLNSSPFWNLVLVASLHHHNNHYDQKICECSSNLDFLMIFYAESNALLWIRSTFGFLHSSRKIIVKNWYALKIRFIWIFAPKINIWSTHTVWKLFKMSHLNLWILAFSINFCTTKNYLSGNTVWPQASDFQN